MKRMTVALAVGALLVGGAATASATPAHSTVPEAIKVPAGNRPVATYPAEGVQIMKELSQAYGGPWNEIRESLGDASRVNYTWFTQHVVPDAWNRGRAVIIGEAAHSCPPTIAQGAAQAAEDALVLSELLLERDAVDQALWDEFHARRLPRATEVVEASVQLGQWQIDHVQDADVPGLMRRIAILVSEPA